MHTVPSMVSNGGKLVSIKDDPNDVLPCKLAKIASLGANCLLGLLDRSKDTAANDLDMNDLTANHELSAT